jgi:hypothetical protein
VDGVLGDVLDDLAEEGLYHKADMVQKLYPNLLSNPNMKNLFYFLWGKAIRRELATKHQMNVNCAISFGEDLSCSAPCYLDAETVYMSREVVYLYTTRGDSLTTSFKTSQITQLADVVTGLHEMEVDKPQGFEAQIARYSCFICFAILAAAAEGGHFEAIGEIKRLIFNSHLKEEIRKACFSHVTTKTRISVWLMKRHMIRTAFCFLFLCKQIKSLKKGRKS